MHTTIETVEKCKSCTTDTEVIDLDMSGFKCPFPLLQTKKKLAEMQSGEKIRVISTDPQSFRDFSLFIKQSGHTLIEHACSKGVHSFVISHK